MKRGEIRVANLNPPRGCEVGKIRPVLVMQANELIDAGAPMVIGLPLTTQVRAELELLRVTIPARDRLKQPCQVILDQPRALDRARMGGGPLTRLTRSELEAVERGLKVTLGMDG
ncbi:MAG: type II toxin-antitoxin system PemK/MazF family toxin [Gammaproteobacteria bacterium]